MWATVAFRNSRRSVVLRRLVIPLALLAGCSHDAARENPLDPELTTPVRLSVAIDDSAGAARLSWTPYADGPAFARYDVLRSLRDSRRTDTLAVIDDVATTSWADTSLHPDSSYAYRVATVNDAGLAVASNEAVSLPFALPAVGVVGVDARSDSASARVTWTEYAGPRFAAYEVVRSFDGVEQARARIEDRAVTAFVDTGLTGGVDYRYRADVVTARGERIRGADAGAQIHALLGTIEIDRESGTAVRLRRRTGGGMEALLSASNQVRLLLYDASGRLEEEQVLVSFTKSVATDDLKLEPESVSSVLSADGVRRVTMVPDGHDWIAMLGFDASGAPNLVPWPLFESENLPSGSDRATIGRVMFVIDSGLTRAALSQVEIRSAGAILGSRPRWDAVLTDQDGGFGSATSTEYPDSVVVRSSVTNGPWAVAATVDTTWTDVAISGTLRLRRGAAGLAVGFNRVSSSLFPEFTPDRASEFNLVANQVDQHLQLSWAIPIPETVAASERGEVQQRHPLVPNVPYRLHLGGRDGPIAGLDSPVHWFGDPDPSSPFVSLVEVDGIVGLVSGVEALSVTVSGGTLTYSPAFSPVSELRAWRVGEAEWIGVSQPAVGAVRVNRGGSNSTTQRIALSATFGVRTIGLGPGQGPGHLLLPTSFDGAADGRVYALDAGNSRVQVFDLQGDAITQWGAFGSGPGEFDFSDPELSLGLGGSIAVAEDGTIWVADIGNSRIQRFAP